MCGDVGHQTIRSHYHPSILDDKGVPNKKNSDCREGMNMSYIRMMKKKDQKLAKAPILENQMKQPKPKKEPHELTPSNLASVVGWSTFYHWGSDMGTLDVWNGSSHIPCNVRISATFTSSYYPTFKT
jgi:hypothetical protein